MAVPPRRSNPYESPGARPGLGRRPSVSAAQIYRRPTLVTVLAVLNFIGAPMSLLFSVVFLFGSMGGPEVAGLLRIMGGLYLVLGLASLFAGIGLWSLKGYGRTIQIALAFFGLLGFPLGTIISAAILVYFFKPGVKALFSEKPIAQLTEYEIAEIQQLQRSSGALVVVLAIVIPLVLIAFIGIIAAIAIPSLLRARVSANEASAIGKLRTVVSAEVAYSQANGGQFDTLECLASPHECLPTYAPNGPTFLQSIPGGVQSGYQFEFYAGPPTAENDVAFGGLSRTSVSSFVLVAYPAEAGLTGVRSFCADSTGQVCAILDGSKPAVADGACPMDCVPLQ